MHAGPRGLRLQIPPPHGLRQPGARDLLIVWILEGTRRRPARPIGFLNSGLSPRLSPPPPTSPAPRPPGAFRRWPPWPRADDQLTFHGMSWLPFRGRRRSTTP